MRLLGLVAAGLGAVVVIWEIPFIGRGGSLWMPLILIGAAVIVLGIAAMRHGGE